MHLACGDATSPALIPASGPRLPCPTPTASPVTIPSPRISARIRRANHRLGDLTFFAGMTHDRKVSTILPSLSTGYWISGVPPNFTRPALSVACPQPPARTTPAPSRTPTADQAFLVESPDEQIVAYHRPPISPPSPRWARFLLHARSASAAAVIAEPAHHLPLHFRTRARVVACCGGRRLKAVVERIPFAEIVKRSRPESGMCPWKTRPAISDGIGEKRHGLVKRRSLRRNRR